VKETHGFLDRTFPIIGQEGYSVLGESCLAISGLGGVGGGAFLALVRAGVRKFKLAENGVFDPPDMNRQAAAFGFTMGKTKLEVYEQWARSINPEIELTLFPEGITLDNMDALLEGCDAYIGVIDIEKGEDVKRATPTFLEKYGIPLFTCGVMGFGALMINYHPDKMMPDEFWKRTTEKYQENPHDYLPAWLKRLFNPRIIDIVRDTFLSKGIAATTSIGGLCSNTLLASEVIMWLLRDTDLVEREIIFAPTLVALDLNTMKLSCVNVLEDNEA